MSAEQIQAALPILGGKENTSIAHHPLGPLTASEIATSATLIKAIWPSKTEFQFKVITLQEPDKSELVPFLAAERAGRKHSVPDRRSFVVYYIRNTVCVTHQLIDRP